MCAISLKSCTSYIMLSYCSCAALRPCSLYINKTPVLTPTLLPPCIGVTPSTWTQACLVQLSAPCPIQQKRLQSEPNYAEMVVDQANTMRQPVETQRLGQIALRAQGDC